MSDHSLRWEGIREVALKLANTSPDLKLQALQHCYELVFHQPASGEQWEHFMRTYHEASPQQQARILTSWSTRRSARFRSASLVKMTLAYSSRPRLNLLDFVIDHF